MNEEEKIKKGILFTPADPELVLLKQHAHNLNVEYNKTYENETEQRKNIIRQIVGEIGDGYFIQGPIFFHYGCHTKVGKNFFANFNLTIQDDAEVSIGENCNFGPNVTIVTPIHPMLPNERLAMLNEDGESKHVCYAKPVHIGNNIWLGANTVVCPGVTLGDNCVIGAGSVVVKDIPPSSFAAGNPCQVIRKITEADSMIYKSDILGGYTVIEN